MNELKKSLLPLLVVLLVSLMLPSFGFSQSTANPTLYVTHQYLVNQYGYAYLNETLVYNNTASSTVTIPTVNVGIPTIVSSLFVGNNYTVSNSLFAVSRTDGNNASTFTITPLQASIQPNSKVQVSLKSFLGSIISTANSTMKMLLMTEPTLDTQATKLVEFIQLPQFTSVKTAPAGFNIGSNLAGPFYARSQANVQPTAPKAYSTVLQSSANSVLTPIHVYSVSRVITSSPSGRPQVIDTFYLRNTGTGSISSLRLLLLSESTTQATALPSTSPPLSNPTTITISGGNLVLTSDPFRTVLTAKNNYSFTLEYPLAGKYYSTSGSTVTLNLPKSAPIDAAVDSVAITSSFPSGIRSSPLSFSISAVTPVTKGSVSYSYSVSVGWGVEQAVPVASMVFVVLLVGLVLGQEGRESEEEEEDTLTENVEGMITAIEERVGVINDSIGEMASRPQEAASKSYFDNVRGRIDGLRSKVLQRINEAKQNAQSKKLQDLLIHITETEKEADRAAKDLINLYEQYNLKRMRQDTFERLLPNYKRRYDRATNQLSDAVNSAQKESKLA